MPASDASDLTPPVAADATGGVLLEDLKIHASTKKGLLDAGWTVELLYRIVDLHGWQGILDIMDWKDDSRVQKISDALEGKGLPPLPDDGVRRAAREAKVKRRALCKACGKREKTSGRQKCHWCHMLTLPIEDQIRASEVRLEMATGEHRARVPEAEWPEGERWCAGCQSFIPTLYATGSRCKACASKAAHATRLKAVYGITRDEYESLLEGQDNRCYICLRTARSRRLAVDHNHTSGEIRGLLCSDNERGCNHAILGNITGIEMARRIVDYLEEPPARRFLGRRAGRVDPPPSQAVNADGADVFDPFA